MHVQASSYLDRLNALLRDAQARGEYLGVFRVLIREDVQSLDHGNEESEQKLSGRTPSDESGDRGDVVVVDVSFQRYLIK